MDNLSRLQFDRFTVFEKLSVNFSSGVNVLLGTNGTGKTHLMKVAYAACEITKSQLGFADKLVRVFLPFERRLGRLVKRQRGKGHGSLEIYRGSLKMRLTFLNQTRKLEPATGEKDWKEHPIESVYIPVKEMLSHAPGFGAHYRQREVHFEEIYSDIIDKALLLPIRGPIDVNRQKLLSTLQKIIDGSVTVTNEEFFLHDKQGNLEFTLLSEGMRKMGLLWKLIQNGTLLDGSVLFWDEPETNLNPKMYGELIEILLQLQRLGVQIFIATHDYVILKEIDLRKKEEDIVAFHSLYRDDTSKEISCHTSDTFLGIHPNAIAETFASLYDRDVEKSLGAKL